MGRSRKVKKKFQCRHTGYGAYCHRCEQADTLEVKLDATDTNNQKLRKKLKSEIEHLRNY